MILKERSTPIKITYLEALLRRLPYDHLKRSRIEEDLFKRRAGYRGEKALDQFLINHPLTDDFLILNDLRLSNGKQYFQIDSLLINNQFALILETKNIYGTLFFDQEFNQLIRTSSDSETGFPNPLVQARRQQHQLANWLNNHLKLSLPIQFLIVITSPSTVLKTNKHSPIYDRVTHLYNLEDKIQQLADNHLKQILSQKELQKLNKRLNKNHIPEGFQVLQYYDIKETEILRGVYCLKCNRLSMVRKHGTWVCIQCSHKNKNAHREAIDDYFSLIHPSITNREFRNFLMLSDPQTATRLLSSLNLPSSGSNKGKIYFRK
ncbi:nuclease-related domain-containing protein [Cytobacillus oceanisediminis]|uniref:nuclease-related domain-containing protein n=1 Tax=Cytobacillus oceanisediminis TaxID=665099 RepID=UPI00373532C9